MALPFFIMVAGPNGSGKTTLTDALRARGIDLGHYLNADEIALTMAAVQPADRPKAAQAEALRIVADNIRDGISTTFETVMSHESKLDLLEAARLRGFRVRLFFVSTSNPVINYARVVSRVAQGGHDVPTAKIHARYGRTMGFLAAAASLAHDGVIYDNSAGAIFEGEPDRPLRMVGSFENVLLEFRWRPRPGQVPDWVTTFLLKPIRKHRTLTVVA